MRRTALATAGAAVLLGVSACFPHTGGGGGGGVRDYVTVMRQTTHGVRWQLDAWEGDQGLCLAVDGPAGPGDADALGGAGSGACTFSAPTKKHPDSSLWFAGTEPGLPDGAATVGYGPVPPQAARVQVAARLAVPAVPLPAGHRLPHAKIWWAVYTPGAAGGTALDDPRAFTASGQAVALRPY